MSTDIQLKGDSRRRQLELSRKYADEHDLQLVELDLEDIGVSAFRGANVTEGALGRFLQAADSGKIDRGSYLLVESLDRISRQELNKSLTLFLRILDAGINIVTIGDGHVYLAGQTELNDLVISLVVLSRAYEESRTKAVRISQAWANKRAKAGEKKLTKTCPAWLKLSRDRKTFELISDRAAVVHRIFEETASGIGNFILTRRLNQEGVLTFGASRGWHNSYISKILNNRAAIGEFQPHKLVNARRVSDGEVIKDYFPPVVSHELFYRAQAARRERLANGAGRKGPGYSNLFSGLIKCMYCKSPVKFENKGKPPKGAAFLVCDSTWRGLGCSSLRWRYDEFEEQFLSFVYELDLTSLFTGTESSRKKQEFHRKLEALTGELAAATDDREKAFRLLLDGKLSSPFVSGKIQEFDARIMQLQSDIATAQSENAEAEASSAVRTAEANDTKALIRKLRTAGEHTFESRALLAMRLRSLVKEIQLDPGGLDRPPREDWTDDMRAFGIMFKDDQIRAVVSSRTQPNVFTLRTSPSMAD